MYDIYLSLFVCTYFDIRQSYPGGSYPLTLVNLAVSIGLLRLHTHSGAKAAEWNPPFRAWTSVVVFFMLSNVFLTVFPLVPPADGHVIYEDKRIPYWVRYLLALPTIALN